MQESLEVDWDESWRFNREFPFSKASPLSIPCLGLAYRVGTTVVKVAEDSPAERAGLETGDMVRAISFYSAGREPGDEPVAERALDLEHGEWGFTCSMLQRRADVKQLDFHIERDGQPLTFKAVRAEEDTSWPVAERGLILSAQVQRSGASLSGALRFSRSAVREVLVELWDRVTGFTRGRLGVRQFAGAGVIVSNRQRTRFVERFGSYVGVTALKVALAALLAFPLFLIAGGLRRQPAARRLHTGLLVGFMVLLEIMLVS
ncbi:MAG: hypothetical protein AB7K24_12240 [Gemmataceae bacterium]